MPDENESGTGTAAAETGNEQNEQEHQEQASAEQTATETGSEKPGEGSENQTEEEKQAAEEAAERERKARANRPGTTEWHQKKIAREADRRRKAEEDLAKEREARIRAEERAKVLGEIHGSQTAGKKDTTDEDSEPEMPLLEDFENSQEWRDAMKQYNRDWYGWQKRHEDRESKAAADRKKQEEDATRRNQMASERQKAFESRRDEILDGFREEFGDEVADKLESAPPNTPIGSMMQEAIWDSEHATKILKFLFDHKEEADKISRMGRTKQAVEIDRIERLVTAPPKKTTNAPPPVRPGSGGTSGPVDLSQIKDDKEWYRKRQQQLNSA